MNITDDPLVRVNGDDPVVMTNIAMEHGHGNSEFSLRKR